MASRKCRSRLPSSLKSSPHRDAHHLARRFQDQWTESESNLKKALALDPSAWPLETLHTHTHPQLLRRCLADNKTAKKNLKKLRARVRKQVFPLLCIRLSVTGSTTTQFLKQNTTAASRTESERQKQIQKSFHKGFGHLKGALNTALNADRISSVSARSSACSLSFYNQLHSPPHFQQHPTHRRRLIPSARKAASP